jgi:hypothetical protein
MRVGAMGGEDLQEGPLTWSGDRIEFEADPIPRPFMHRESTYGVVLPRFVQGETIQEAHPVL